MFAAKQRNNEVKQASPARRHKSVSSSRLPHDVHNRSYENERHQEAQAEPSERKDSKNSAKEAMKRLYGRNRAYQFAKA